MFGSMGGVLPPVVAHLIGDITEFSASMAEAGAEVQAMATKGEARLARLAHIGKTAALGLAAGALIVGGASVHMASQFDATMERVHTQAGAAQSEVDNLKNGVLKLAGATGEGPTQLADALYHVESVGYRGATAMAVLTNAAKLATISGADLDETTYGLTSVMQTYGAKAQDAAKWAAFFNGVVGTGDMRMEAFNKAVGTGFFSTAQTFGVSAQSAGAALAFMTDRGQHADEAATRLRMSIALLAAPSVKSTKILHQLGLTSTEVATAHHKVDGVLARSKVTYSQLATDLMKPDGFYVALTHLKKGLTDSGMSAQAANSMLSHAFGGGRSDATILAMLNNLDTLKKKYVTLGHNVHTFGDSWKSTTEQFNVKVKKLEASAEALGIKLGNFLIPKIESLVTWLMKAADWAGKHKELVEGLAIAIGGALMVAMAAWIVTLGIAAVEMIAATWPILAIIAAVALLVAGILWLKKHWSQVWGWVKDHANKVAESVKGAWDRVKQWTSDRWQAITDSVKAGWGKVTSWLSTKWHQATDPVVHGWDWLHDKTVAVFNKIKSWFAKWWPLLLVIFAPFIAIVVALWNHFHKQVWDVMVKVWTKVSGWLSKAWGWISGEAKSAWGWVYSHIVAPVEKAYHYVTGKIGQLVGWLRGRWHTVQSDTSSVWNRIYSAVAGPIGRAYRYVEGRASAIRDTLRRKIQQARDWLSGVGGWFSSIGSAIVHGIIHGVEYAAGGLFTSLSHLANSALQSAKSFLGINSPSKVFSAVVGRAIPEGIAHGVMRYAHVAHAAVGGLAASLPTSAGGIGMALAGASAGAHALAVLNLHLTTEAKVDGEVLFKTTQRKSLQYEKRNGRPAFTGAPKAA